MLEMMLNPATIEQIWTLSVITLLMTAGGLTIWLLPWSDEEILAVHQTVKKTAFSHLPVPLTTTTLTTAAAARDTRRTRPLVSA